MPAGPPPDQQAYDNRIYTQNAQQQNQAQFQHNMVNIDPRLRSASLPSLGPAFNSDPSHRVPASFRNQELPSMTANYPSMMNQKRYFSERPLPPTPFVRTPSACAVGPSPSASYSGYDYRFQPNQNQYQTPSRIQPVAQSRGYVNPFQGDLAQLLPQVPPVLETRRLPLIGLPQRQGLGPEPGSTLGPLDPYIYHGFPAPAVHHELDFMNQEETQRHLALYIDDNGRRKGESVSDYRKRTIRAAMNMNLVTRRRPPMPQGLNNQERRRWHNDFDLAQIEHRERIDPNHEDYDRDYAEEWHSYQTSRRQYNANQRVRARDRLRGEYEAAGYPNFPDPPEHEDSGDDLFTHDEGGVLCNILGDAPQRGKSFKHAPSDREPGLQNKGLERPPTARGPSEQGQEKKDRISAERCENCAKRNQKCSLKQSGKPCDRCNRLGLPCKDHQIKQRGNKQGNIRGPYNKRNKGKDKSESKQTKNKRGQKIAEEEEEEPELNDDEESEDDDENMQPQCVRKRNRPSDDEEQQDERNPKRMATRSSLTLQQKSSVGQQSLRTRVSNLTLSRPCANCAENGRICSSERPCTQCLDRGERDCGGDLIDQPYRPEIRHMTPPTRFNGMGASSYPTPSSAGYADRRAQSFDSPTPGNGYAQDIELHDDVSTRPLAPIITHQRQIVPIATAEAVLQDQSETWMGGRGPATDEVARRYLERIPDDEVLDTNNFFIDAITDRSDNGGSVNASPTLNRTSHNAIDPALGSAENPHLPSSADLTERQAALKQTQNPSHGASNIGGTPTRSPVNQFIRMVRVPSPDFNNLLPCQEPVIDQPQPTCGRIPTKTCDDVRHVFDVCDPCESSARIGPFNLDEVEYALKLTQQHMCRYCADETKTKFSRDPNSEIQGNHCHCIGQLRMAWLCGVHRDDAVQGVGTKALSYGEWRARNLAFDDCPACNARKGDESTRVISILVFKYQYSNTHEY
ncbi:hypothetical protein NA56DRAFT_651009 [Hyaloscypha hepaticicola]|uniref:Zn(2)-C6 fungal-type domain-containing protein n=1 Tax=Hyaloscypha hepaticicola TaxID=2082293 RepID=A0A2J6PKA1_9HELO|nr:hypothetical protein NA56DRAFT_651009 [Hyaloscypha hepaticicola]